MSNQYYFYMVRCKDGSLYSGVTSNLENRIKHHNQGKGGKYTRAKKPVILVYKEIYNSLSLARIRENEIKNWRKEKRESLLRSVSLGLNRPRDYLAYI